VYEEDTRQAEPIEQNMDQIPEKPEKEGICYLMVDGSAVNTRQKGEKGSTWKENKLGMVFTREDLRTRKDGITQDIQKKEYGSYIGPAEEFKKYLLERAVRKGYGWNEKTILLSDGAAWIRNMGEELFPDALQIRDFYHVAEHLYSFGKYLFGGDEARYTPWAEELIGLLRESKPGEVLKRLEGYKDRKLPPGTVNPYTYMQHNRNKVDYGEYKRQGTI
jgi:hypothetical protein